MEPAANTTAQNDAVKQTVESYANILRNSKNVIFHGAPGTGKTYLARQIAAYLITGGTTYHYKDLTPAQRQQVGFVQFHPSYDYVDFVGGLRPAIDKDTGAMSFVPKDGIFKRFVDQAIQASSHTQGPKYDRELLMTFLQQSPGNSYYTQNRDGTPKRRFYIDSFDDQRINVIIPDNNKSKEVTLCVADLLKMLQSDKDFSTPTVVAREYFHRTNKVDNKSDPESSGNNPHLYHEDTYYASLWKIIREANPNRQIVPEEEKPYIFIIDEINRGEISKIFGELFFAIDPGYRGEDGGVTTQYASLLNQEERFYLPKNVYLIGTMNDIDRSVDTFDFAMRRRFRFVELKADDHTAMLDQLGAEAARARRCMQALNAAISDVEDLNDNYQIGGAYFLKLKDVSNDYRLLWSDYLEPLLRDYVQGLSDAQEILDRLKTAYDSAAAS